MNVGEKEFKTDIVKSNKGELVFVDPYELNITNEDDIAQVNIYSYNANDETSELISSGQMKINSERP